ncbi:tetratricopeptide repeat protein [Alloacidobacterium dinghuense]|uniref:Tetratricopeptide repeat protein n=1 Tax=Alloacidobacterium dinghuense TaxID=2763107 RepID=A0A7G8BN66_9BACT|nr:tetratricopeptide repeat protein [Alloacidobacterium dinghuense]
MLRARDYSGALKEFETASTLNPKSAQTYAWLGITQNQLREFAQAAKSFQSALRLDPSLLSARYNYAHTLVELGDLQGAIRELTTVVKTNPSVLEVQYNLAVLLSQTRRYSDAGEHFEIVHEKQPSDAAATARLADCYFHTSRQDRATQLIANLQPASLDPTTAALLASDLIESGSYSQAVSILTASDTFSASLPGKVLLAKAYLGNNQPDAAIQVLQTGADTSTQVSYLLGLAYLSSHQSEHALSAFRAAAATDPKDALAHYHLGVLLLQNTSPEIQKQGAAELQTSIQLMPGQSASYEALAKWQLQTNQAGAALALLQDAARYAKLTAQTTLLLGLAQASVHGTDAARPMIEQAIALDPHIALAHNVLGFCYFRAGDYRRASDSYAEALRLEPANGLFAYDVALALEKQNKIAEAIPFAEKAAAATPPPPSAHYLLGKLYAKAGKLVDAIHELEIAIQLNPSMPYPYYLLARTYMQSGDAQEAQEWNTRFKDLKRAQDKPGTLGPPSSEPVDGLAPSLNITGPHDAALPAPSKAQ